MILRILKSNHSLNYLFLVLFGTAFWSASLGKPELYSFYTGEEKNILYYPIHNLLKNFELPTVIVSLVMVLGLAIIIQQINSQYLIIRERNKLPALLFVLMAGGVTGIHTLHPVYFAAMFLLLAIYRLFSAFDQTKPYSASFDSGFLLGIGSLFYFNLILLFPAFLLSVAILGRENRWRVFVIHTLGLLLPFIFALSFGFFSDQLFELIKIFELNITTQNNHFKTDLYLQIYLGFLILLTGIGSIVILQHYDTKKVSSRKFFSVFFLIFIFSMAGFTFMPPTSQEMLVITFIPVSYLVSNLLVDIKSRFWGELIITLLFAIVAYLQITAFLQ
jgi:hypothetical protein